MSEEPLQAIRPADFSPLQPGRKAPRWRARPLQMSLAAVLLLFAVALWFLFSARSVLITSEPAKSSLNIDGGLQLKLGDRYLLRSGDYQMHFSAEGYYPLEQALIVGGDDAQSYHFELQRLPGLLDFSSQPGGARVTIDGELLGETPLRGVEVAAGSRQLELSAERYKPLQQGIDVTGMGQAQEFSLALEPAWATVALDSVPPGAIVLVDGEPRGQTPARIEILEGDHQIGLQLTHHRGWQQDLAVVAGENQQLATVALLPADGILNLGSHPDRANVTVDGEYQGQTPLEIALEPGTEHRIAVFKPGYGNAQRSVSLEPEEQRDLKLRLKPLLGEVLVRVVPADAMVSINGKTIGEGSRTLSLPAFEQTLKVTRKGYQAHSQRFTPRQGLSQVLSVRLLSEAEARLAALKPRITTAAGQNLRLFTPGDFTMGASRREPGRRANEVLHPVSLSRRFYIAEQEVSNEEFRLFRAEHNSGRVQGETLNNDRQPVVMVSWNDAALYCNWLSAKDKLPLFYREENGEVVGFDPDSHGYRMPSEAEWAWAARANGAELQKFSWGDQFPPQAVVENFADKSSAYITGRIVTNYNDGHVLTAPTGSFPANRKGLYDLGGNVAEWVHDVYSIPSASGIAEQDPLGAQQGSSHVIRGASWAQGTVTELRLSFRDYGNQPRDDVGFRIARYAEVRP